MNLKKNNKSPLLLKNVINKEKLLKNFANKKSISNIEIFQKLIVELIIILLINFNYPF